MEDLLARLQPWLESNHEPTDNGEQANCRRDGILLCTMYEELVRLLQQYPGGLTEAVMLTQLQTNLKQQLSKQQKPHHQQQHAPGQLSAAVPLASCLGPKHKPADHVVIQATISELISIGSPDGHILQLTDSSTSTPVGLFVHSQQTAMLEGPSPLLAVGSSIRAATTLVKQLGLPNAPPLMPTVTMAVCIPQDQWQQALTAQQLPGSFSQVYSLRDVLAGGLAALGQQDRCTLNGWLTAQVVQVGNVQTGYQACDGASSRTWSTCSITLRDSTNSSSSSEAQASTADGATLQWLLLDETVKYGQLLQPGEQFAVYCPTVRRYQQHPTAEAELVLESSGGLWTLVRADDNYIHSNSSNSGQQDTAGKHAEHCSLVNLEQSTMFDSCMDVVVGQQDAVLCGVVSNISSSSGCNGCSNGKGQSDSDSKGAVTCYFADTIADMAGGRCLQLQLQFQPGSRTRAKVIKQLRDGHVLLLTRVTCQQQQQQQQQPEQQQQQQPDRDQQLLMWYESFGSVLQDLSCLPALLTTPPLQNMVTVQQLEQAGSDSSNSSCLGQRGVLLVRAVIQSAGVVTCRLHKRCERPVQRGTSLQMDCDTDSDDIAEEQPATAAAAPEDDANRCLWACAFCGLECSGSETDVGYTGHVMLADAADADGSAEAGAILQVEVDSAAWHALLLNIAPAKEAQLLQPQLDSRLLQQAAIGKTVTAAVYAAQEMVNEDAQTASNLLWHISAWNM